MSEESSDPYISDHPMYQMLRHEQIGEFNEHKARGEEVDLTGLDFRNLDLQGMDASGLDFSGSYFRGADLRGIDFSSCNLEGASINSAKVSGCYFPKMFSAVELTMSLTHGTRLRKNR